MPHSNRCASVCLFLLAALAGCQNRTSTAIASQYAASGGATIDLASAVPVGWDRVCVLGPYSNNTAAAKTLGFEWPAESRSSIATNEGISLLVFVQGNSVASYVEHRRDQGDFSNLTGRCFAREHAKFRQLAHPAKGWPGLFPANEA